MNGTTSDSKWGISGIGSYVVLGTVALLMLIFLFSVTMSAALMPARGGPSYDIPGVLRLWWSVSPWLHGMVTLVLIVGLGLLSRVPQGGMGKTGIIVALIAEVLGFGIDILTSLLNIVIPSGGGSAMRAIFEGLGMLGGLIGCIASVTLALGAAGLARDLRAPASLPAAGVAVVAAVIGYLVPTVSRLLRLDFFYPGSASSLMLNAISLVRYAGTLFVLWQCARAIAAASAAGARPLVAQPAGGQPGGPPPGAQQW